MPPPLMTWVVNDENAAPPAARIVEEWQMAAPKNPAPTSRRRTKSVKSNPAPGMGDMFKALMYDVVPFLSGATIGYMDGRFSGEASHKIGKHWGKLTPKKKLTALAVLYAALAWWGRKFKSEGKAKLAEQMEGARHGIAALVGRYLGESVGAKGKKAADAKAGATAPGEADAPKTTEGAGGGLGWQEYKQINDMVGRQVRQAMDEIDRRKEAGQPMAGLNLMQLPGMHDAEFDSETLRALAQIRIPNNIPAGSFAA